MSVIKRKPIAGQRKAKEDKGVCIQYNLMKLFAFIWSMYCNVPVRLARRPGPGQASKGAKPERASGRPSLLQPKRPGEPGGTFQLVLWCSMYHRCQHQTSLLLVKKEVVVELLQT